MLSKHPLELPPGRKLSPQEVADALRLSIIAELDAISLYLQLARAIDDEKVSRVFGDIAKEEKTHVGEFLTLLKSLDPEQVEELKAGEREVEELTGVRVPDPPQTTMGESLTAEEWSYLSTQVAKTAEATRSFRGYLPQIKLGRGYPAAPLGAGLAPLEELSEKFKVSQAAIDFSRASRQPLDITEGLQAAARLALREDEKIRNTLLGTPGTLSHKISSWDEPGAAVREVGEAVSKLVTEKHVGPYVLFVSPARYVKLLAVHEKTGVMELTRLKALVRDVVPTPVMPEDVAVLVSSTLRVLDVVIGADTEVEYLGPEDGVHVFRVWETIALRVYDPKGVVVLKQG
jgi:uncharacterized linocin/CFP29 family protein